LEIIKKLNNIKKKKRVNFFFFWLDILKIILLIKYFTFHKKIFNIFSVIFMNLNFIFYNFNEGTKEKGKNN